MEAELDTQFEPTRKPSAPSFLDCSRNLKARSVRWQNTFRTQIDLSKFVKLLLGHFFAFLAAPLYRWLAAPR